MDILQATEQMIAEVIHKHCQETEDAFEFYTERVYAGNEYSGIIKGLGMYTDVLAFDRVLMDGKPEPYVELVINTPDDYGQIFVHLFDLDEDDFRAVITRFVAEYADEFPTIDI